MRYCNKLTDTLQTLHTAMHQPEENDKKSKSQKKREMQSLRELGKQLTLLDNKQLGKIPLPDTVFQAICEARSMKREALRRQIQFIGSLLRSIDTDAIYQTFDDLRQNQLQHQRIFHEVEQCRDALLEGDQDRMENLFQRFPEADRQHLRLLIRNANKEKSMNRPPKSARTLFRYLLTLHKDSNQ